MVLFPAGEVSLELGGLETAIGRLLASASVCHTCLGKFHEALIPTSLSLGWEWKAYQTLGHHTGRDSRSVSRSPPGPCRRCTGPQDGLCMSSAVPRPYFQRSLCHRCSEGQTVGRRSTWLAWLIIASRGQHKVLSNVWCIRS